MATATKRKKKVGAPSNSINLLNEPILAVVRAAFESRGGPAVPLSIMVRTALGEWANAEKLKQPQPPTNG